jgi:hypothetical protein
MQDVNILTRAAKVAGDFRTIWIAGIGVVAAVAWAGDARYATHEYLDKRLARQAIYNTQQAIKELQLKSDIGKADTYDKALLKMKQQELDQLKTALENAQ